MRTSTSAATRKEGTIRSRRVQPAQRPPRPRSPATRSGAWLALPLLIAYGLTLGWLVWQGLLSGWVLPASLALNFATFLAYWHDKRAAQARRWRISEASLHGWSLAGGWGGAWFAQQMLRHKSAKASFRATYWATVAMHCATAAGLAWFWRVQ